MSSAMPLDRQNDLVFAQPGGRPLLMDISRPADRPGPLPVVLYLHPGGWAVGDRRSDADRWERLCAHGFAVASAEYRLSGEATFPAQLDDARAALDWLREHGAELGLDAEHVGVWGASAGAHLAVLLGHGPGGAAPGVAAIVGYFGTYELGPAAARGRIDPAAALPPFVAASGMPWPMRPTFEAMLLGVEDVADAPDLAAQASPVAHASSFGPPIFVLHGDMDALVSPDQSRWMVEAVEAAGGWARHLVIEGANHEDPRFSDPDVIGATAGFFREALER